MKTLKRLLKLVAPFKKHFILSVIYAFLGILSSLFVPVLIGYSIDKAMLFSEENGAQNLFKILLYLDLLILFSMLTQWLMRLHSTILSQYTAKELRNRLFRKQDKLPLAYLDSHANGDFVSLMSTDIDIVSSGLLDGFTQVFSGLVTIFGTLFFMFF